MHLKETRCELDSNRPGKCSEAGPFKNGNEALVYIKGREYLD
jgi:hypothetical protein